jgi:uncharacterized repeat protein (TIGR03803 family)
MKQLRILSATPYRKSGPLVLAAILLFAATAANSQIFTVLYDLGTNSGDPQSPQGHYAQARDGNLYSTSPSGGSDTYPYGTVFQLTPAGKMKVLASFTGMPTSGLTLGTDGNLYGTTISDGTYNSGTVFKITTGGKLTVLHNFTGKTDGSNAVIAPVQGTDGNYYGAASNGVNYYGTIYKMTPAGVVTPLYEFTGSPDDNYRYPQSLIQGSDGNFYGITPGSHGSSGMVFKITPQGKLTPVHEFAGYPTEGQTPVGSLIQASDGNFYGATHQGGTYGWGTIYKMTPAGVVTTLRNFQETDGLGRLPSSGPVQGTDGNFYGGTSGGPHEFGILYQITSSGTYTILYDGFSYTNGTDPADPLFQHTNGTFYSDTVYYGTGTACLGYGCGVLYSFSMGFGPFVSFVPAQSSGKVGKSIGILGQGFTGTTNVSFNGASATFTVVSGTYLTAAVPADATTGVVTVATPGGTLTSNKIFGVVVGIRSFSPTSGPVGTAVVITGNSLTGATKVTFGGVKATSFTVNSDTQVTAIVPATAKTGKIAITTPSGAVSSSGIFTVTP